MRKLGEEKLMNILSIVQDLAEALEDIQDGKGRLAGPLLLAFAGLLSAVVPNQQNVEIKVVKYRPSNGYYLTFHQSVREGANS
ncbi:hypothetical protein Ddye_007018 [Dipteronia dyeriana]|uniref:Uncharacterized protein n=1 Tax=Dipteronia dyeriana TaxID=168575 RepID=A0AAD9XJK8_9ROSI|nr:hypothetical protein Ddye_007018 [Dipteronia dyeriana]